MRFPDTGARPSVQPRPTVPANRPGCAKRIPTAIAEAMVRLAIT
jgi:hypothetical protein